MSAEEDAVAEKSEAGTPMHLAFQELGLGADAFGRAVVMGQRARVRARTCTAPRVAVTVAVSVQ
jgi:hypothetical protein